MANGRKPLPPDLKDLLSLIRLGQLFALQEWIRAGKRLRFPEVQDRRAQILGEAIDTGFHSMVQRLLEAGGWDAEELIDALDSALRSRRSDIVELLLAHGAPLERMDFEAVCYPVDLPLMERYLRAGGDPSREHGFARALSEIKARPFLRFYRQFRAEFPALDDQAALALTRAAQDGHVGWAALLQWAGADPFRPVPWNFDEPFPVDEECNTNAASAAVWRDKPEMLKVLRLQPTASQALELLDDAASCRNLDLFRTLLKPLAATDLNATDRQSCSILEWLVGQHRHRDIWSNTSTDRGETEALQCIELLLDAGARWDPPLEEIRSDRRGLLDHDGRYIVQVLRLLLYTPRAASIESVLELSRSQRLRAKVADVDRALIQELNEIRKQLQAANCSGAHTRTEKARG